MITATRTSAAAHLLTAQELSLVRHSLADELADINEDLVPNLSDDGERTSTLLGDIQSLHRDLDELSNLKAYVLVIERAVKLRLVRLPWLFEYKHKLHALATPRRNRHATYPRRSRYLLHPYPSTVPCMTLLSKLQSNVQRLLILLVPRHSTSPHFCGLCVKGRGKT